MLKDVERNYKTVMTNIDITNVLHGPGFQILI
jgi:hypothetical protein